MTAAPVACPACRAIRYDRFHREEKTIFVYLLVSGCLGLVFAIFARDRIRADGLFGMPAFGFVATFGALIVIPAALYLSWAHADWSWMYVVDASSLSAVLGSGWALAQVGALLAGWALGGRLVRSGNDRGAVIAIAATGAAILASITALADRLTLYGTHETFAHDVGLGLMEVKLGYVLVVLALAVAAASAQVCLELARDSRRVRVR